jgi:hypothetical protein
LENNGVNEALIHEFGIQRVKKKISDSVEVLKDIISLKDLEIYREEINHVLREIEG